jgi:hypothetical protein
MIMLIPMEFEFGWKYVYTLPTGQTSGQPALYVTGCRLLLFDQHFLHNCLAPIFAVRPNSSLDQPTNTDEVLS